MNGWRLAIIVLLLHCNILLAADAHPLPLASHWNTGGVGKGFTLEFQLQLLDRGSHLLPWLALPAPAPIKSLRDVNEPFFEKLAERKLPFTLIASQWERLLLEDSRLRGLSPDQTPNVVTATGQTIAKVCPFGPVEHWQTVGAAWTTTEKLRRMEAIYPDPPRVIFLSNNEQAKLEWPDADQSRRFVDRFGAGKSDEFKRKAVGDGWIERYRTLENSMRSNLVDGWKRDALFVGYNAFGPCYFGRWNQWPKQSLVTEDRVSPFPACWDGASPPYYLNNWESITDDTLYSPQVQAMNWVFMLEEARRTKPDFWFELSVWDGHVAGKANDKWKTYADRGQAWTPERYAAMVQFGMWLLRPAVVREFRASMETLAEGAPYFLAVVGAVDRVHANETLREFWQRGSLVPNRKHPHPYQTAIPGAYQSAERWFLLDTKLDAPRPWKLNTEIPVYSLALVQGESPNRRWLVYAHSPRQPRSNVRVTIPDYKDVVIDATVDGAFFHVAENGSISKIPSAQANP